MRAGLADPALEPLPERGPTRAVLVTKDGHDGWAAGEGWMRKAVPLPSRVLLRVVCGLGLILEREGKERMRCVGSVLRASKH